MFTTIINFTLLPYIAVHTSLILPLPGLLNNITSLLSHMCILCVHIQIVSPDLLETMKVTFSKYDNYSLI